MDIMRLDLIHPVVSGNKWFKLRYHVAAAAERDCSTIVTMGGAYSNHLVATAYTAKMAGFKSIGLVRGEMPLVLSPALQDAAGYGMELCFIPRQEYKRPDKLQAQYADPSVYWISEGGRGEKGVQGAATILQSMDTDVYTHIICAVGTGTMLAGLIASSIPGQAITGISVLKNHLMLKEEVRSMLPPDKQQYPFDILDDYHFGGYAKHPSDLLHFMAEFWERTQIPTDIVYTGKLIYAVEDLIAKEYFPRNSRLLVVHSGGLQGNRSLPQDALPF